MTYRIVFAASLLILLATVLPLHRSTKWWVRDLDFPRLQLAAAGLLLLAVQPFVLDLGRNWDRLLMAATAGCVLYQAFWIWPYTRLHRCQVRTAIDRSAAGRLRILASNVLMTNRNPERLITLIRTHEPDIFVTLETDTWWQARLDALAQDYPHSMKCPLDNLYGMHVYSRLPLEDASIRFLVQPDVPSMHATVPLRSGRRVEVHFLHPAPPSPTENDESTERDVELLVVAKHIAGVDRPVIVAGDLNDVAWSATTRLFLKISRLLDPRIGRGMFNTFHANYPFMRWPLDHLFHSSHFTLSFIERLPSIGSDHFPVLVELVFEEDAVDKQEGLPVSEADEEEAEEKIQEGRERTPSAKGPAARLAIPATSPGHARLDPVLRNVILPGTD